MIKKITLAKVASYENETSLETDKEVNLIYGLNGSGKTIFSDYLKNLEGEKFSYCSVEGFNKNHQKTLVYNQSFVEENFYETKTQKGIFTLAKENKDALKKIKETNEDKEKLLKEQEELKTKKIDKENRIKENHKIAKKKIWDIKDKYTGGDRVFDKAGFLDGFKGSKDRLFSHLKSITCPVGPTMTIEEIKSSLSDISGDTSIREIIETINARPISDIEKNEIFEKKIVGNKDSSVAGLIEELQNSDWVKKGIDEYIDLEKRANCPFCQEEILTEKLVTEIENYFDKTYEEDLKEINELYEKYKNCKKAFNSNDYIKEFFDKNQRLQMKNSFQNLSKILDKNLMSIENKIKGPSSSIDLSSSSDAIEETNKLIKKINEETENFNEKIQNKKEEKKKLKNRFWETLRKEYDQTIKSYIDKNERLEKEKEGLNKEIELKEDAIEKKDNDGKKYQKEVVNIDEVVGKINQHLLDFGIQDFEIVKHGDSEYRLERRRNNGSDEAIFRSLSEGEKTVISFLYFVELCGGKEEADDTKEEKIVVIDDPVSSLSFMYVFNVAELIKRVFLKNDTFVQIFILTHNLYFFYELVGKRNDNKNSLFRISKKNSGSIITQMKKNEIQNEYQSYWTIIRDGDSSTIFLVANAMRNVIECFFGFIDKSESINNIFQTAGLDKIKYNSFKRYIDRESHTDAFNISDSKEFNYDHFKEAFKMVFEEKGYKEHYEKMMG